MAVLQVSTFSYSGTCLAEARWWPICVQQPERGAKIVVLSVIITSWRRRSPGTRFDRRLGVREAK
jgi:hypothetical protein